MNDRAEQIKNLIVEECTKAIECGSLVDPITGQIVNATPYELAKLATKIIEDNFGIE